MSKPQSPADTDAWLDALAGRRRDSASTDDAAEVAEGLLLREALRRWPRFEPAPDHAADRVRLAALLAAAQASPSLASHRGCAACQALARWWSWRRLASAMAFAAAILMTVVLIPWMASVSPPPPGADSVRGSGTEGVQRLRAADPRALRDRIVDELVQAGVRAERYERIGRYGLDAELPPVRSEELIRLLRRHGLEASQSGVLAVEVEVGP